MKIHSTKRQIPMLCATAAAGNRWADQHRARGRAPTVPPHAFGPPAVPRRAHCHTPVNTSSLSAQELVHELDTLPAVAQAAYAGSLRRMCETIGDIDLLVASTNPESVMDGFAALPSSPRCGQADGSGEPRREPDLPDRRRDGGRRDAPTPH